MKTSTDNRRAAKGSRAESSASSAASHVASTVEEIRSPPQRRTRARAAHQPLQHALYPDNFALLNNFAKFMQKKSLPIDVARMQFDRLYGVEQLQRAYDSGDEKLRQLAVVLTIMYDVRRV